MPSEKAPQRAPKSLRCPGYAHGCNCPDCRRRVRLLRSGDLFYDDAGELMLRAGDQRRIKQPWEV